MWREKLLAALSLVLPSSAFLVCATLASTNTATAVTRPRPPARSTASSNILPEDYVGPESCKDCHAEKYALWSNHPHSVMNQNATQDAVLGDFSGKRETFGDRDAVTFARDARGAYTMSFERDGKQVRKFIVTRTVGSRFSQFYIGRQIEGPEPPTHALYTEEHRLLFCYWFRLKRWVPWDYFDPVGPEYEANGKRRFDHFADPEVHRWRLNCILCHNTIPYLYRLGARGRFLGLPFDDVELDVAGVTDALGKTLDLSTPLDPRWGVMDRLDPERHFVRMGISCESCHFGGREHALEEKSIRFLPTSPLLRIAPKDPTRSTVPSRKNPYAVNAICAQCHRAAIAAYPNGAGTWNSREAGDLLGGKCASAIKCTDCHDPHVAGGPRETGPDDPKHIAACTKCHEQLATPAAAAAHSRHSAKTTCLDCHMPRATQGLDEIVRTHMISSPTDTRMLASGDWNSCNLCHLDRSLSWTLAELEKKFGKKIAPAPEWARAYGGSLERPVGEAWLRGPSHTMRNVAVDAYARTYGAKALPELIAALDDAAGVNRVFAMFAIERVRGRALDVKEYDVNASRSVRAKQVAALVETARR